MLIDLIVGSAVLLALGFLGLWCLRRDLREQIERPKYQFQNQLKAFNQQSAHRDERSQ